MKGRLIGNLDFRNQNVFSCCHTIWVQEDEQLVPTWFEILEWGKHCPEEKNKTFLVGDLQSCLLGWERHAFPQKTKILSFCLFLMTWFSKVGDCIFKIALKIKIKLSSLNKCKQHTGLLLNQFVMNSLLIIYYVFYNLWVYGPHSMIHSSNEQLSAPCSRNMWLDC